MASIWIFTGTCIMIFEVLEILVKYLMFQYVKESGFGLVIAFFSIITITFAFFLEMGYSLDTFWGCVHLILAIFHSIEIIKHNLFGNDIETFFINFNHDFWFFHLVCHHFTIFFIYLIFLFSFHANMRAVKKIIYFMLLKLN